MIEEVPETIKDSSKIARDEGGRILPGQKPLNPAGRPKGKTLKEFAREYYMLKTDDEKIAYIQMLEEKKPGFAWSMAEGNPHQSSDVDLKGGLEIKFTNDFNKKDEKD